MSDQKDLAALQGMRIAIYQKLHLEEREELRVTRHVGNLCSRYWSIALPDDPKPLATELTAYKAESEENHCRSAALYLGDTGTLGGNVRVKPNLGAARACAILHATSYPWLENNFEGYRLLAILSANGDGTPQSWPVAMHYGCMAAAWGDFNEPDIQRMLAGKLGPDDLPRDGLAFILAIERAMDDGVTPGNFDGCDHPIVGNPNILALERDDCKSFKERRALSAAIFGYKNVKFGNVALSFNEIDSFNFEYHLEFDTVALSAMTLPTLQILSNSLEERHENDKVLEEINNGVYPVSPIDGAKKADEELNIVYKEILCWLQCGDDSEIGTAFRDAQRQWLDYRNKMISAAMSKTAAPDQMRIKSALVAQLTQQRVADFNRWINYFRPPKAPSAGAAATQ